MCGIVGAIAQRDVTDILLEGLKRLEYRGYDSSGIAVIDDKGHITRIRRLGKVKRLIESVKKEKCFGRIGIAHTRWATHGIPSEINAHPHISENIIVAHNGMIENHLTLRKKLINIGYCFASDTDTEVIAHLLHYEQKQQGSSLHEVVLRTIPQLRGSCGMIVMDSYNPSLLIAVRLKSSLIIGLGTGENFISSDQFALLPVTNRFICLEEGDVAEINQQHVNIMNIMKNTVNRNEIELHIQYDDNNKGIYHHYMQKEIYEQPIAIKNTLRNRIKKGKIYFNELNNHNEKILKKVNHIHIIACGTSYNSGMVSRYWFESLANLPCDVDIASEFRYRKSIMRKNSLLVTLSQSGETADTLAALRLSKKLGYIGSLTVCNVENSSLVRESDMAVMTKAGIEIGVASTKSFTTQLVVILMLVSKLGSFNGMSEEIEHNILHALQTLPSRIEEILAQDQLIKNISKDFSNKEHALFIGRGEQYPIAIEGALKLKEISYIHAEGYAAGELKHGPLALVDSNMPVIVIAPNNKLLNKLKCNIEEIRTRGGKLYIFTDCNSGFLNCSNMKVISLPYVESITSPIFYAVPLQLLSYYVAIIKKTNVDQPRNLAKSVTVE
ncbi:MAG: glutamine--fructose-6-phosphate transaminase (isomerizing) [Pantoea sp. Brub]|nr:glutamine--fructose-6-phosphate transaminase (isomerizing) [Pantoea sp. Brub]